MHQNYLRNIAYSHIKDQFFRLIEACGGMDKAATHTRVGKTALYNYANRNQADAFPPADVIQDLEFIAGYPYVSEAISRSQGFITVDIRDDIPNFDVTKSMAEMAKEYSDVFAKTGMALSDGTMTPAEAAEVLPEIAEAAQTLMQFERMVRQLANLKPTSLTKGALELRGQIDE